jgi:N-acetylmuramoyl-L-alanine amidase
MPWTDRLGAGKWWSTALPMWRGGFASSQHGGRHLGPTLALTLLLLLPRAPAAPAAGQEYLSVYSSRPTFSVPLLPYAGREYVGILDLLDPLGDVSTRRDDGKWKLRFNGSEVEFQDGKTGVKLEGKRLELSYSFYFQDGRGLVPLSSIVPLLSSLLRQQVELHESARRLFLGGTAVHFTAQLVPSPADSVVLNFSAPVNPSIATEPGRLRMTFVRDPVLHPSPSTVSFENKSISTLTYREEGGAAELTLNSSVPLLARFSADRRTITVGPVVQIVAQAKPQPAAPAPAPTLSPAPAPSPAAPAAVPGQQPAPATAAPVPSAPPPLVVVDAGHGGTEPGAALSNTLAEKDVDLSIAQRLHNDLEARGLRTMLLRNSDATLSLEQRAILANTSRARFYISIHAGSMGAGVRLYTTLLPPISAASGAFLPWDSAQASFLTSSQTLSANIGAELSKANVASRQMAAPLPPLNHVACAALAVEVLPPGADLSQLSSPAYQEQVAAAIAAGVVRAQQGGAP